MNEKQFKRVLPEDFDAATLLQLAREGKLYICIRETKPRATSAELLTLIYQYIQPIATHATHTYAPHLETIWRNIVQIPTIEAKLTFVKGKNAGQLNRYFMLSLVDNLRGLRVYDDSLSLQHYHNLLEHTHQLTSIYKGQCNYPVSHPEEVQIKRMLKKMIILK